jgi:hypothetical protein
VPGIDRSVSRLGAVSSPRADLCVLFPRAPRVVLIMVSSEGISKGVGTVRPTLISRLLPAKEVVIKTERARVGTP